MQKAKVRFRRPTADEQTVLSDLGVKLLVRPQDIQKCDQLLIEHHYLHSAQLVGEQLRYAVTWKGQWFAVATWSAAAFTSRRGISLLVGRRSNGANGCPGGQQFAFVCSARVPLSQPGQPVHEADVGALSSDWESTWGHPVALAESFVDPSSIVAPLTKSVAGASWAYQRLEAQRGGFL